jgi:hypothetical protein
MLCRSVRLGSYRSESSCVRVRERRPVRKFRGEPRRGRRLIPGIQIGASDRSSEAGSDPSHYTGG